MKIKVEVRKLIRSVEESKKRANERYREELAAYPALEEAYRQRVAAALQKTLDRVERGGKLPGPYGHYSRNRYEEGVVVIVGSMPPKKPAKPTHKKENQRLRELRLTSSPEITIDPWSSDWNGLLP